MTEKMEPMRVPVARCFAAALLLLLVSGISDARSRKIKPSTSPEFSYYLLVLSYAPDFCNQPQGAKDPRESDAGRHIGFVVHGLWPQSKPPADRSTAARPVRSRRRLAKSR